MPVHILVIGDNPVPYNVAAELGLDYKVTSMHDAMRMADVREGTTQKAVQETVSRVGVIYPLIIIDYLMRQFAPDVKEAGYDGWVIGIVSAHTDKMEGTDELVEQVPCGSNLKDAVERYFAMR